MNTIKYPLYFLLIISTMLGMSSCKKETIETPYPYTEISSFLVDDGSGGKIEVAIDQNTLTLYWPGYDDVALPEFITPEIKIADKASISPASGEKVTLTEGLTYTVTAEDGTKTVYTFKLVNNQPAPLITNETPISIAQYGALNLNSKVNYYTPSILKRGMYLVGANGTEYDIFVTTATNKSSANAFIDTKSGTPPPAGAYKLKLVSGQKSVTSNAAFITVNAAAVAVPYYYNTGTAPIVAKAGDQIVLPFRNLSGKTITSFRLNGTTTDFIINGITTDGNGVTVTVPAGLTPGDYNQAVSTGFRNTATNTTGSSGRSPYSIAPIRIVAN